MTRRAVIDRLLSRVEQVDSGCWLFTGALRQGYGVIGLGSRTDGLGYTHRVAYEHFVGPIPAGLHIDHLCRERACCNPDHLEAVTQAENNRRAAVHRWADYTHCKHGHEFTPENTIQTSRQRHCIACIKARNERRRRNAA